MNSLASHRAQQSAQALYDAMEDDSWEDGDPLLSAVDELIAEANRIRTFIEKGAHDNEQFEHALDAAREAAGTCNYIADLAQMRID